MVSCILMTGYIFYQFFYAEVMQRDAILITRFAFTCLASPVTIALSIYLFRYFGWRLYKKIGADQRYIGMYQVYQLFVALMRMDVQLQVMLVLLVGLFWLEPNFLNQFQFYLDIGALVVNFILAAIGLLGVRYKALALAFTVLVLTSLLF